MTHFAYLTGLHLPSGSRRKFVGGHSGRRALRIVEQRAGGGVSNGRLTALWHYGSDFQRRIRSGGLSVGTR
jgi:hypothetical protein